MNSPRPTPLNWDDPTAYRWKLTNELTLRRALAVAGDKDTLGRRMRRLPPAVGVCTFLVTLLIVDLLLHAVGMFALVTFALHRHGNDPTLERQVLWTAIGAIVVVPLLFGTPYLWARRPSKRLQPAWHKDNYVRTAIATVFFGVAYLIASPHLPFRAGFTGATESWRGWTLFYTDVVLNTALFGIPNTLFGRLTDIAPATAIAKAAVAVFKGLVVLLFVSRLKSTFIGFAGTADTFFVGSVQELCDHLLHLPMGAANPTVTRVGAVTPVEEDGVSARLLLDQYPDKVDNRLM